MYWLIVTRCFGELQAPISGRIFGCEKILSFGNSSLKSREMRGVISRKVKIFATMSLFCQRPLQVSPDGLIDTFVCNWRSSMLMPLKRDRVASRDLVLSPNQLWSLMLIFLSSWPLSIARSWSRFARSDLALSKGVSPSLLASDTRAPWLTSSSAMCWYPQKQA